MTRQSSLWRLALAFVWLLALAAALSAQTPTPEVYIRVREAASPTPRLVEMQLQVTSATPSPTPRGRLPVLFVHGHNTDDATDGDRNYRKNWQDPLRGSSFMQTLDLEKNEWLDIEDYYIRFRNQGRSIGLDALEIREAIDLILHRHDPSYAYPHVPGQTTDVKVVIIAYSKGTLSSRLYLKNLHSDPNYGFNPVSEFIALSPPNHGIKISFGSTCAGQQLVNGLTLNCNPLANSLKADCEEPFPDGGVDFIKNLNNSNDTPPVLEEAPGNRADANDDGVPNRLTDGTLYVTIFDGGNRDFVGGENDPNPNPCQSRPRAANLSPHAVNIPLAGITDDGFDTMTGIFRFFPEGTRRAAAVHQNTVHTPEAICHALYAAAHHRSPKEVTSCKDLNLAGVSNAPPPVIPKAAVMLTLDFSGSMGLRVCPEVDCQTRAEVLQDAVDLFVRLWMATGGSDPNKRPGDRLGATYFSTNVTSFPATPLPNMGGLLFLDDGASVSGNVFQQSPNNATAMGGGLQLAINTLKAARARTPLSRVILFTDGLQNVNPMVVHRSASQLVIESDNDPLRPISNIPQTNPITVLDQSSGIAIDTIGIGAADVLLLQEISTLTNGQARTTVDANLLNQFFTNVLIDTLRGSSPQLVSYRRGSVASKDTTEAFAIESGVRRLVLMVNWKRGSSLDFSVARDGVDVTSVGHFINGTSCKIFVIDLPPNGSIAARGNWAIRINGKATTKYEAAAIVDGSPIAYDSAFDVKQPKSGDPLEFVVRLTAGGRPISGSARVTVTLISPAFTFGDIIANNPAKDLPAFEPGMSLAQRQLLALSQDPKRLAALKPRQEKLILEPNDKGEFRTRLSPQVPGIYTAFVTIEGDAAGLGKFSRSQTLTTVVRFANPDAKSSDIFTTECTDVSGHRYVRLVLSPRDTRGHFMGPGLPSEIALQLSAGRMVGNVRDLGDGGYMLLLEFPPAGDPTIKLEVAGSQLFSGRLSQVSRKSLR